MNHERNWSHDPIKMAAKSAAEQLFKKYFQENMKGGSLQQFKETYPTLYFQVIIPMAMELLLREHKQAVEKAELIISMKYIIENEHPKSDAFYVAKEALEKAGVTLSILGA
jgi:hypothetical protein